MRTPVSAKAKVENSHPKFRNDLIVSRQEFESTTYYVIKDPVTRRFFRVKEFEYFIAEKFDAVSARITGV